MASAVSAGYVQDITVWGIGQPAPPTIDGPDSGCEDATYDFTVYNESCYDDGDPNNDLLDYQFDWGDGTTSSWSPDVPCGQPVTMFHHYEQPGDYEITVSVRILRTTPRNGERRISFTWGTMHRLRGPIG